MRGTRKSQVQKSRRTVLLLLSAFLLVGVAIHSIGNVIVIESKWVSRFQRDGDSLSDEFSTYGLLGRTVGETILPDHLRRRTYAEKFEHAERSRQELLEMESSADEFSIERLWFKVFGRLNQSLWSFGWTVVIFSGLGAVLGGFLTFRRHGAARWVVIGTYLVFAGCLYDIRSLMEQAFVLPILEMDGPRDASLRWHPAALIWFGWTAFAVLFALWDGRPRRHRTPLSAPSEPADSLRVK